MKKMSLISLAETKKLSFAIIHKKSKKALIKSPSLCVFTIIFVGSDNKMILADRVHEREKRSKRLIMDGFS